MGVLQRFERRLEGLVEGAFARAFGGVVQPVEVAAALQREAADKKAIVGAGRVLVPNDYVVELGSSDAERLAEYDEPLRKELSDMVSEYATEQGWSFVGPVSVRFEPVEDLATGVFRVRSAVVASQTGATATGQAPEDSSSRRLEVVSGSESGRVVQLTAPSVVIGRGAEADVRLTDTGVSRRHAELQVADDGVTLVDLRSTNGTSVNGRRVDRVTLTDGDRIGLGTTVLVFRQDG
ncbi:MAG: domain containing protein [Frankiales bacterium]|nr:domain containing protein [Frankiales bacterium]